jgi:hypothetical protein
VVNQWPASLPQYLLTRSYKETAPDLVIRTKMDAGPAKVRRRFTSGVRQIEGLLVLAQDQVATLDNFFLNDCQGGAVSFLWTYQREVQDTDAPLDTDLATDTDTRMPLSWLPATVRFVKPPQYHDTGDGTHYEVSLSLEILP